MAMAIFLVGLLIGVVPASLKNRRLQRDLRMRQQALTEVQASLNRTIVQRDLARALGRLGLVMHEVNRNNFGNASVRATEFFDTLREVTAAGAFPFSIRQHAPVRAILSRRDEISGDLARADPAVRPKLSEIYLQLEQAIRE